MLHSPGPWHPLNFPEHSAPTEWLAQWPAVSFHTSLREFCDRVHLVRCFSVNDFFPASQRGDFPAHADLPTTTVIFLATELGMATLCPPHGKDLSPGRVYSLHTSPQDSRHWLLLYMLVPHVRISSTSY